MNTVFFLHIKSVKCLEIAFSAFNSIHKYAQNEINAAVSLISSPQRSIILNKAVLDLFQISKQWPQGDVSSLWKTL